MDDNKPIGTSEVIKSFLAANLAKGVSYKNSLPTKEFFNQICDKIEKEEESNLYDMVKDKIRLERFINHRWFLQQIPLKYIGGYPRIGDLPKEWSEGSVVDSANQIANHLETKLDSIIQIKAMLTIIDEIITFFPPILLSGGEIRNESSLLFLPFDSDDGSHRCITAALAKKTKIKAYVGLS